MVVYQGLSRAQLSFDYLHTNSTTHEFLFGALAELLDNARDARARRMDVYTEKDDKLRGGYMLCFLDDGTGMDPAEVATVIQFGKSTKRMMESNMIGQYGNGLKSGAMRIGKDFILFTKQGATMSCLFLSRTFHEEEKIEEVIVPMPSFEKNSRHPFGQSSDEKQRHKIEMDLIYKYSPFKTEEEFFAQFDRIEGDSGTLVIIYHMKLMDNGDSELDTSTDASDILLAGTVSTTGVLDDSLVPERQSFRAYTSILYAEPKMKIYIQGHKVHTRRLAYTLHKPKLYKYTSTRFKTRSEIKTAEAVHQAKVANEKAREAESKARDLEKKYGQGGSKDKRALTRQAQTEAFELRQRATIMKKIAEKQQKSLKEPKTINFHFGINLGNRRYDGVFIYNCGRLIKMYERVGPQIDGGVQCSGVVGFVDVPYLVLEPTHNKQDFADAKEYRHLLKAMGEHMVQYWKDINIASLGVTKFWENFGYISHNWKGPPSEDPKFVRKRAMQTPVLVQCDACLKWRIMPFSSSNINRVFSDDWQCSMNTDTTHNRCSSAEQKVPIPTGIFKKEVKSAEEQKKEILEDIKKKQEKLGKIEREKRSSWSHGDKDDDDDDFEEQYLQRERRTSLPTSTTSKPIGKASPVQSYKVKPTSRPIGKASPVVNQQQSRRPSVQPTAKPATATTVGKYTAPAAKHDGKKAVSVVERKAASRPQKTAPPAPVARKVYATKRQSSSATPAADAKDEDKSPEPTKKRRLTASTPITTDEEMDDGKNEDGLDATPPSCDTQLESEIVGKRVKARIDGQWYAGRVVKVFQKEGCIKWKVKFDQHPKDKYDKSFDMRSEDIRLVQQPPAPEADDQSESPEEVPGDLPSELPEPAPTTHEPAVQKVTPTTTTTLLPEAASPPTPPVTTPTPTTPPKTTPSATPKTATLVTPQAAVPPSKAAVTEAEVSSDNAEDLEESLKDERLAQGFRKCLRYFLPPLWPMNKEMINNLSVEELSEFPLDSFFDQYEKGLRNLVGGFQAEAAERARETEATKIKLAELRKLIAQLLRSINDEIVVSDTAGEEVDVMLAACVKQAMQDE